MYISLFFLKWYIMKSKIFLLLSLLIISYSCYKEDTVKPSADEERYVNIDSLKNQGKNIYQDRLISYADKYGVLTMYQFNPILFYYEIVTNPVYKYKDADESSVGTLLDLIDEVFYSLIGDKAILKLTPLNILLVSDLEHADGTKQVYEDCYFGLFSLTFSGADAKINSWDKARKQIYKNNVTSGYLKRAYDRGSIKQSLNFGAVSEYNSKTVNESNYKEYGFVENNASSFQGEKEDFYAYIRLLVSTPTADLTAPGGFLDPEVDKKGLIKKKYDIVVKHFKEYDIDLVKIGNYQIK